MKQWIALLLALTMLLGVTACGRKDKTETFEAYYQEFTEEDVVYEDSELFVDSQLLLTAVSGTKTSTIEKLIKDAGGKIVGYIEISDDYQIEFPEGKTLDELNQLVDKWNGESFVEFVSLHNVFYMDTSAVNYETDPWLPTGKLVSEDDRDWSLIHPDGTNWWVEMINMPAVWAMDAAFEEVRVGIIDSMFDASQEDLAGRFISLYCNPDNVVELYKNDPSESNISHGTHVAGIIAANNNDVGIAGVSQNAKLYAYAMHGDKPSGYISLFMWSYQIATLLADNVKVINISMGDEALTASAWLDAQAGLTATESRALKDLDSVNKRLENFLENCLEHRDFLIIKSAGNNCNQVWTENNNPNRENPYSYKKSGVASGRVCEISTDFDVLGGIDNKNVRRHIIMVGSVDLVYYGISDWNSLAYSAESSFSNANPDVYAPGGVCTSSERSLNIFPDGITGDPVTTFNTYEILSAVPGGYDYKAGTSMAAPVVTGIAALIWGVNPELTAEEVRSIIVSSAESNERFPGVVDALSSVNVANRSLGSAPDGNSDDLGTVMGYAYTEIVDKETGEESEYYVAAEFTLYTYQDEEYWMTERIDTAEDYTFSLFLEPGYYSITAKAEGFNDKTTTFELDAGDTRLLAIEMTEAGSKNNVSLYIPIIEEILNSDDYSEGEGFLYDTDGDGLDELILLYSVSDGMTVPKVLCTVCDIENNEVIYHIDELQVTTLAGAPEYCVGVVETVDGTAFMIYTLGYAEGGSAEEYTIYDGTDYEQIDVLWRDYYGGQYFYSRHGESLSELDFEVLIDSIEFQDLMGSSYSLNIDDYRFSAMTLEELLEYLQGIEDTPSADDEPTDSNKDWKQLYYDFIVENKSDYKNETDWDYVGYQLLYLDEDDIPELWIDYAIYASGCGLATICDDEVCFELLASGYLEYEENNNTFLHSTGHQGMFMDTIYSIEDGEFCIASEGYYNIDRGEYYWGESSISAAAYEDIIGEFVDRSLTKNTYEDPDSVYTYEEILSYLADEDTPKSDIEQTLTEEEVLSLAQKYWDIYPGEVEDETGFAYGFMVMSYPTEDDPNYTIALRHYVEDHMSTVDMVLVNATTGECKSFW